MIEANLVKQSGDGRIAASLRSSRTRYGTLGAAVQPKCALPETDPAYSILIELLGIVPASRWMFARIEHNGGLGRLWSSPKVENARDVLADELDRQRRKNIAGPRIGPTLRPLDGGACGITMVFADVRATFGVLTLSRAEELGPFTSSEISMLTFALDVLSDRLSALRLQRHESTGAPANRCLDDVTRKLPNGAFYVLDADLKIVLAGTPEDESRATPPDLGARPAERLPSVLEQTVRELTASWSNEASTTRAAARPVSFLIVRTQPMYGPAGRFIGVRIDRFRQSNSLTEAASRFHISPRETQVLGLVLDGNHLHQIADELNITPSTVQDHIKSMLGKTGSGNRSELIARVLGWESAPRAGLAS